MWDQLRAWLGLEHRALTLHDPVLHRLYGDGGTASGEGVPAGRAIGLTAVWACVTLIAGAIASMPLILYRRDDDGRARAVEHPLYRRAPGAPQSRPVRGRVLGGDGHRAAPARQCLRPDHEGR